MPDKLLFGPAGIPHSTPKTGILAAVEQVNALDLGCMELEFVRSVYLSKKTAPPVAELAKKHNIMLTCHGSYYINLNSDDKAKVGASRSRILQAAEIANLAGVWSLTFHAAYYMKQQPEKVYSQVKEQLSKIVKELKDNSNKIWIRPETTGKGSQFGTVDEIIKLSKDLDQVLPCIDFSHLHARSVGKENTLKEFRTTLEKIEKGLGRTGLNNMHIHVSGINYGQKGELNHLDLKESDMNYMDLMKSFREFKIKGCVISESPNQEDDALLMKKTFNNLRA